MLLNCGGIIDLMDHLQTRLDQEDEGSGARLVCEAANALSGPAATVSPMRRARRSLLRTRAVGSEPPPPTPLIPQLFLPAPTRRTAAVSPPYLRPGEAPRLATELPHAECKWYILDSHRPYNLNNVIEDDGKVRASTRAPACALRAALHGTLASSLGTPHCRTPHCRTAHCCRCTSWMMASLTRTWMS